MKRFMTILTALLTLTVTASAMSYSQARERALFLTDKMAYELNLTEEQYDAAYEVNLDYLMSINTYDDLYGVYWSNRNLDLSYILLDWQYRAFCAASYFYRPLYWSAGVWHFAVYSHYPRRNHFYFHRPTVYVSYRGGHSCHHNGGRSWYKGRRYNHNDISRGGGMKDRYDRGYYKQNNNRGNGYNDRGNGGRDNNRGNGYNDRGNSGRDNNRGNGYNDRGNGGRDNNRGTVPSSQTVNRGRTLSPQNTVGGNRTVQRVNRESSTRTTVRRPSTPVTSTPSSMGTPLKRNNESARPSNTFTPKTSAPQRVSRSSSPQRSSGSGSSRGGSVRSNGGGSTHSGGGSFGGRR